MLWRIVGNKLLKGSITAKEEAPKSAHISKVLVVIVSHEQWQLHQKPLGRDL